MIFELMDLIPRRKFLAYRSQFGGPIVSLWYFCFEVQLGWIAQLKELQSPRFHCHDASNRTMTRSRVSDFS